ncbi:MAG TPA: zf-HC2 domain-containing protein [Acidobacteriaceae bacterium]|nr:zf-HC2 domain-containing protein [Acidobacteriaceae bacterium]
METCQSIRERFSAYLDGALTGILMQETAAHLESCEECGCEFAGWRATQSALTALGPAKAPADLALRLRVALSQEKTRTARQSIARWHVRWQNSVAPFLLRASAGFASAVVLLGTAAMLVGAFASPQPVEARAASPDQATSPRFLYSMVSATTPVSAEMRPASLHTSGMSGAEEARAVQNANSVVVEAYVNRNGRVYDYRIISGPDTPASRAQVENLLLFSVFEPARVFGEPVRGVAVLSFSGISVQG